MSGIIYFRWQVILSIVFYTSLPVFSQTGIKKAPANPDFVNFLREFESSKRTGFDIFAAPSPAILRFDKYFEMKKYKSPEDYPVVYDMRTAGPGGTSLLTPVKHQLSCGACWAFATYSSMESVWKVLGLGDYDLSENNLKNCHGFDLNPCTWGHHFMSTAYLVRGSGPISETDDPYIPVNDNCTEGLVPQAYIPISRYLPEDHDAFKETIMNSGAVYNTYRSVSANYSWINGHYTYCYQGAGSTTHAIAIVGWNDTITTACGNGAWIAKNSYGTGFGESGYFYISYKDTLVLKYNSIWPEMELYDPDLKIYQYDTIGGWPFVGYEDPVIYGLIKYTAVNDQYITGIGTYTVSYGSWLSAEIYEDFDGSNLSGQLASAPEQYCDYPGFWQISLSEPLKIQSGNDFYIKVKYYSPGEDYPMAVEGTAEGYCLPHLETGKCWTSPDEITWHPAGEGTTSDFDLCIKAYAWNITKVDVRVFLEGPFNGTDMNTDLTGVADFPLTQPYNIVPWNYSGTESVSSPPPSDIVDWVLLELRETTGEASTATASTVIARQAVFLKNTGQVVGTDGSSLPEFLIHPQNNLYVVVYHRNHLGIMSSQPLTEITGVFGYDFTNAPDKAYSIGQKEIGTGIYGMVGGDGQATGLIDQDDRTNIWNIQSGMDGYREGDFDLDQHVSNPDKNDIWLPNLGVETQIPE